MDNLNVKKRIEILLRDDSKCQLCSNKFGIDFLHIHHVDGNRKNNISDNLLTLCKNCHTRLHRDRNKRIYKKKGEKQTKRSFCLKCGGKKSQVIDSRYAIVENVIRRRRQCETCGKYTTYEMLGE